MLTKSIKPHLSSIGTNFAVFITVCASCDRMVAVWFPLKMKVWCNTRVAWAQILVAMVIAPPLNFPTPFERVFYNGGCIDVCTYTNLWYISCITMQFLLLTKLIYNLFTGSHLKDPNSPLTPIQTNVIPWVTFGVVSVAAELLIIFFNVMLLLGLYRQMRRINSMKSSGKVWLYSAFLLNLHTCTLLRICLR